MIVSKFYLKMYENYLKFKIKNQDSDLYLYLLNFLSLMIQWK